MNGIFLAAACLGALVTISVAEPKMQELKQDHSQLTQPIHTAELTAAKLPPASKDIRKGEGSMTTTTIIDTDPATGDQMVTEEQVIAFHD